MRILITGVCGFVGRWLARSFANNSTAEPEISSQIGTDMEIWGIDNLNRPGSELNRQPIQRLGVHFIHGDLRNESDLERLPKFDWIIDCAALVSVMSGVDGKSSSRQLVENNLLSTVNLLEICRRDTCGLILLSTSRVYSIDTLRHIALEVVEDAFRPKSAYPLQSLSPLGIQESFSTAAPTSLYAASKLASERLAQEYSLAFEFPLRINRCGVLAGEGQFGRIGQGTVGYWIHSHRARQPLNYIGFGGKGFQVRDCLHPRDLASLIAKQIAAGVDSSLPVIANVSGGVTSARSLRQLNAWCDTRFGAHAIGSDPAIREFDIPWLVLDSSIAETAWDWRPRVQTERIWEEIALAAEIHPDWLERSN